MFKILNKLQEVLFFIAVMGFALLVLKHIAKADDGNLSVNSIMNNSTNAYIYNYSPNNRGLRGRNNSVTVTPPSTGSVPQYSTPYYGPISPPLPTVGTGDIFGNWIGQRYNVYPFSPNSLELE